MILLKIPGLILFAGAMLVACVMDWKEQMVYRFIWLFAAAGAGVFVILRIMSRGMDWYSLAGLLLFVVLQQMWFGRFYGRADCHAFCVSAMWMWGQGFAFYDYVMHMFLVFAGLTIVQLVCRNVGKNGRLKKPVPLIPYITAALWVWVDFMSGKWYIYS